MLLNPYCIDYVTGIGNVHAHNGVLRVAQLLVTLHFRLVVQKLRREFTHAQNFLFKTPAQSARMRGFSLQFLDNQPEIECIPLTFL